MCSGARGWAPGPLALQATAWPCGLRLQAAEALVLTLWVPREKVCGPSLWFLPGLCCFAARPGEARMPRARPALVWPADVVCGTGLEGARLASTSLLPGQDSGEGLGVGGHAVRAPGRQHRFTVLPPAGWPVRAAQAPRRVSSSRARAVRMSQPPPVDGWAGLLPCLEGRHPWVLVRSFQNGLCKGLGSAGVGRPWSPHKRSQAVESAGDSRERVCRALGPPVWPP